MFWAWDRQTFCVAPGGAPYLPARFCPFGPTVLRFTARRGVAAVCPGRFLRGGEQAALRNFPSMQIAGARSGPEGRCDTFLLAATRKRVLVSEAVGATYPRAFTTAATSDVVTRQAELH
ncbi:Protein of unknown function [Gryllus bimaculatus]|nr:Protein of unknown function [Gryllus bimaculatus]